MKISHTIAAVTLSLLLLGPSWGQTQTNDGPLDPNVVGRNDELRAAFQDLSAKVLPYVVTLERRSVRGYGVIIEGGYVLTAASVVSRPGSYVARSQAGTVTANVLGRDELNNIALLQLTLSREGETGLAFGSDKALNIGQFVVTVGTDALPLAVGVVSAKERRVEVSQAGKNVLMGLFSDGNNGHERVYPSVLHHDGAVLPEHCGSPVVDSQGKLVGINVATPYRGSSHAVGIDQIQTFLGRLKQGTPERSEVEPAAPRDAAPEAPQAQGNRPWLGVSVVPAPEDTLHGIYAYGLRVNSIDAGGPADQAGLQVGDVLVTAAGATFSNADAFADTLSDLKPGDTLHVGYIRASKLGETTITLGKRP